MHTQGIPWGSYLNNHQFYNILCKGNYNCIVSNLYKTILESSHKHLPIEQLWIVDVKDNAGWNRNKIWYISLSSRNPYNQMIHYKLIDRFYGVNCQLYSYRNADCVWDNVPDLVCDQISYSAIDYMLVYKLMGSF